MHTHTSMLHMKVNSGRPGILHSGSSIWLSIEDKSGTVDERVQCGYYYVTGGLICTCVPLARSSPAYVAAFRSHNRIIRVLIHALTVKWRCLLHCSRPKLQKIHFQYPLVCCSATGRVPTTPNVVLSDGVDLLAEYC